MCMYNHIILVQEALKVLLATRGNVSQLLNCDAQGWLASVIKGPALSHMPITGGQPILGTTVGSHNQGQAISTHAYGASLGIDQSKGNYNVWCSSRLTRSFRICLQIMYKYYAEFCSNY